MNEKAPKEVNKIAGILDGFESWTHFLRFSALVTLIFILAALMSFVIRQITFSKEGVIIVWNDEKIAEASIDRIDLLQSGLQFSTKDNDISYATTTVPANELWVRTGIRVSPGAEVTIRASGSAILAIHLLNEQLTSPAQGTNLVSWYWTGPNGQPIGSGSLPRRPADQLRRKMFPYPEAEIGELIGVIVPESLDSDESKRPGRGNHSPEGVRLIGSFAKFKYSPSKKETGILYLAVNDLVANYKNQEFEKLWLLNKNKEAIKSSYFTEMDIKDVRIDEKIKELQARWNQIKRSNYIEAFYEDNVGYYSATVLIRASVSE